MSHKTNVLPINPALSCLTLAMALAAPLALAGCGSDDETTPSSGGSGSTTGSVAGSGGNGTGGSEAGGQGGSGGSSTSSGGGSGGGDAWQSYCADIVEREQMCDPDNPPSPSLDECVAAEQCFDSLFREEAREPLTQCLRERPCDKSDDACFAEVGAAMEPTTEQDAYKAACDQKLTACGGQFSNDWCSGGDVPWQLLTAALHVELTACFAQACDQVGDCLEAALDAELAPCGGEIGF